MKLRPFEEQDVPALYTLWNRAAPAWGYAPMTPAQMDRVMICTSMG